MLPPMISLRQPCAVPGLPDVTGAVEGALDALALAERIKPGMTVGIPVGSRGIQNLAEIVRLMVRRVQSLHARPVVVAAMGSHGGGTAEGQVAVLESLGVTAESIGAPVRGNVDAVEIGRTADGLPVYFDSILLECDALLVMNRVKPHTSFRGPLESGLVKMLVVGCGKPAGAKQFHSLGSAALPGRLRACGELLLAKLPVVGGLAVLENGREETAAVVPVLPDRFIATEEALLERAKALLPCLPVDQLDLLVIDEMGKNISGTGMDTNVIGRMGIRGVPEPVAPRIGRIVVLDLTEASHGNANGMGLADITTRRLANKVDFPATYLNTLTATFVERAKLPIVMESDRAAIETALQTLGNSANPRIIRIKNTLELEHILVSPAVLADLPSTVTAGEPVPWNFDANGNLPI